MDNKGTDMTTSKIRIRMGAIEVEYEGSEVFLKDDLPNLLEAVSALYLKSGVKDEGVSSNQDLSPAGEVKKMEATTSAISAKLQVKSGSELVMAAMARLTFVLSQDVSSRQKIIDEMKAASSYYRATYVSNLTKSIDMLVKTGKLNEPSKHNYALTAAAKAELESRLV